MDTDYDLLRRDALERLRNAQSRADMSRVTPEDEEGVAQRGFAKDLLGSIAQASSQAGTLGGVAASAAPVTNYINSSEKRDEGALARKEKEYQTAIGQQSKAVADIGEIQKTKRDEAKEQRELALTEGMNKPIGTTQAKLLKQMMGNAGKNFDENELANMNSRELEKSPAIKAALDRATYLATKDTGKSDKQSFANEAELRRELSSNTTLKRAQEVKEAYRKIQTVNDNAAGDMSLIYGYMKILDPGSTVREGEFANAQNSAGIPERVRNLYNRAQSGDRLGPDQRLQFKKEAENIYAVNKGEEDRVLSNYKNIAQRNGLNFSNVYESGPEWHAPMTQQPPPKSASAVDAATDEAVKIERQKRNTRSVGAR